MTEARITAMGMTVPDKKVPNSYYESIVDTSEEWIVSRTGIRNRYHAAEDEFASDLGMRAVADMQRRFSVDINDVEMIIVSTASPDQPMPSVACRLQYRLSLTKAGAFDLYAACAGFVYGIQMARCMVRSGVYRKVLVVAAETLSKITDFTDRTSCILFGDGAGAALIEAAETSNIGEGITRSDGSGGPDLYISGLAPAIDGQPVIPNRKIVQNGRKVFKWAVQTMSATFEELLCMNGLEQNDLTWFAPHSANLRILEAIHAETGFPPERTLESIVQHGNTSSASIPIAICRALDEGRIKSGDKILMLGFGGGLTYAGILIQWP